MQAPALTGTAADAATRRLTQSDRRHALRRTVDLAARYRVGRGAWAPCRVCNISVMGALIVLEREADLPDTICLQIPGELLEVTCSVRHQNGHRAGLMFLDNRQATLAKYG